MPNELRCDLHGPYSPEVAALIALGRYRPPPTGHLCADCQAMVKASAQALADRLDADALTAALQGYDDAQ